MTTVHELNLLAREAHTIVGDARKAAGAGRFACIRQYHLEEDGFWCKTTDFRKVSFRDDVSSATDAGIPFAFKASENTRILILCWSGDPSEMERLFAGYTTGINTLGIVG